MRTAVWILIVIFTTILLAILSNRYLGLISYQRLNRDTCSNLLDDGYLLDNVTWQSRGCRMHNYTLREVHTCFKRIENNNRTNNMVFLGDSRMRYLFEQIYAFIQFDRQYSLSEFPKNNIFFKLNNTKFTFIWNKYIDDTLINQYKVWTDPANEKPTLLVTDSCLWYLIHDVDRSDEAKGDFLRLAPLFDSLRNSTKHLWIIQAPVVDMITCKNVSGKKVYCNYMVNKFNKIFVDALFNRSSVELWHTYRKVGEAFMYEMTDGVHYKNGLAMSYHIQILWNYYCNDVMDLPEGTCCGKSKPKRQENQIFQFSSHSQVWYRYVQLAIEPYLILFVVSFLVICAVCTSALSKKLNFNTSKYNIIGQ